jgi:hypothetical protein
MVWCRRVGHSNSFWLERGGSEPDRVLPPLFHGFVSSIPNRSLPSLTAG